MLTVTHWMVTCWPDFGLMDMPRMQQLVRQLIPKFSKESSENPLIHCSAGVGRSGVLLLIIAILKQVILFTFYMQNKF